MKKTSEESSKKKISSKKNIVIYIIVATIIICTLYTLYSIIIKAIDSYTLVEGNVYFEESSVGYIIRDEVIVQGENYKNGLIQIVSEGQRVAKDNQIFRYYSYSEDEIKNEIDKINMKLQDFLTNQSVPYSADIKLLDDQINENTRKLCNLNDINDINEYKNEINSLISKKAEIVGKNSSSDLNIKNLIDQKEELEKKLSENSEYLSAPIAGVVSYRVDELENVLTPNCFDALTAEYLNDLNLKTDKIIATSDEKGKVVDNYYCYIATVMNSEKAKEAEVGKKLKIRLPNGDEISAKIEYINKSDENNIIIVFKINQLVNKLIDYRKINFDVIWWSDTGLKVLNQSILTDDNGLKYIIRNRSGYMNKMLVKVLNSNETHSIITSYTVDELKEIGYNDINNYKKITLYDEIVLNPNWDMVK